MKRQQCLERGQESAMLIYTPLIGNSTVLHLNRIFGPVARAGLGGGDEGWEMERWEGG